MMGAISLGSESEQKVKRETAVKEYWERVQIVQETGSVMIWERTVPEV